MQFRSYSFAIKILNWWEENPKAALCADRWGNLIVSSRRRGNTEEKRPEARGKRCEEERHLICTRGVLSCPVLKIAFLALLDVLLLLVLLFLILIFILLFVLLFSFREWTL